MKNFLARCKLKENVFINCPFDEEYSPILEILCFCVSYFGFAPRLATERLEAGENRLEKIVELISNSRYSIHDLSRCKAKGVDEYYRMNMPFELGIDFGFRRNPDTAYGTKKFLIFEENQYDLKRAISDLAGTDVMFHQGEIQKIIELTRNFFSVEGEIDIPGAKKISADYATFQGWLLEKKIQDGHSVEEVSRLPISERLKEIRNWLDLGNPAEYGQS